VSTTPIPVPGKRPPLTPEQRLEALRRVQAQAEQRIALGKQLFKAAEARMRGESDVLSQVRKEQAGLREQLHREFTESLHSYDQWLGQMDENFTIAIRALEEKIDAVAAQVESDRHRAERLLHRAEALPADAVDKLNHDAGPRQEAA